MRIYKITGEYFEINYKKEDYIGFKACLGLKWYLKLNITCILFVSLLHYFDWNDKRQEIIKKELNKG